jgi:hypothetical protein
MGVRSWRRRLRKAEGKKTVEEEKGKIMVGKGEEKVVWKKKRKRRR